MTLATFAGRKRALRALDANRLRDLVEAAGLTVADRRARDGLIQALADARRLDFSTVIGRLTRDELKAMCRALGLPEDGREKAPIIARLMGPGRLGRRHRRGSRCSGFGDALAHAGT
ncbi:MAG: hypothetical protein IPQ09_22915 [Myxococcales bacterium]|nr:hypothetical protein [Myxococcales bacterium]